MLATGHDQPDSMGLGSEAAWGSTAEVRGRAVGVVFMTIFGAGWVLAGVGVSGMDNLARVAIWVADLLISVGLLVVAFRLFANARHLPSGKNSEGPARGRRLGWLFGLVFGIEIAVIVGVSIILSRLGLDQLILPAIAVVVGVHFVPLAAMFRLPAYYVTGCVLVALGAIGIVGIQATGSEVTWCAGVAFSVGVVLWVTAAIIAHQAWELMVTRHPEPMRALEQPGQT